MRVLITGFAGFIGSNLTRMLMRELHPDAEILGLDCYTYAAADDWVFEMLPESPTDRFMATRVDLRHPASISAVVREWKPTHVYHLAAESHVCRSIDGPRAFAETNLMGTFNLLDALRKYEFEGRLVHVSTDEAFGELGLHDSPFDEGTPDRPNSPYSATKAGSDLLVRAFHKTYGMDTVITRCTNNFGPNQNSEKLIPRTINRLLSGRPMTVHGDGSHMRDWIWVDDHCAALKRVMEHGKSGELYCIGSGTEMSNIQMIGQINNALRLELGWQGSTSLEFNNERPTDDTRYAVKTDKVRALGWEPSSDIFSRLRETVGWYHERIGR